MGFFDKFLDSEKTAKVTIKDPKKVFEEVLRQTSGSSYTRDIKYNIYYQIIAFYGVVDGIGTSTLVANTALAIAETGLTVCVIDTSMLAPSQDVLLNTETAELEEDGQTEHLDWFDLPYTKKSPLHISKYSKNISVLSFKGKRRTVVDFLSTNDNSTLVDIALATLHSKFDIILIDCCHEMSAVNTACLQQAQQVIQVWNDSPSVVANLEGYITNAITLSCPLDKMRYVVANRMSKDAMGSLNELAKQYRCKILATNYLSEELYLNNVIGKKLFRCESTDELVAKYTECIIIIVCHILNIDLDSESKPKGTITSNDIMEGKVDGTYHKELKEFNDKFAEEHPEVKIDSDPLHHDDANSSKVQYEAEEDSANSYDPTLRNDMDSIMQEDLPDDVEVTKEEKDAVNYGGVMKEDDVTQEELTDTSGSGVADILEDPVKAEKRKKVFGKKRKRNK